MSGIFSGAIAAGLLATVVVVANGNERTEAQASQALSSGQAYRLQVGGAHSCTVERGDLDMRGKAEIRLDPGCEALYPDLAQARFWSESADGTLAFTGGDGGVLIEFSVADGAAYESFKPGAPLASLIAIN